MDVTARAKRGRVLPPQGHRVSRGHGRARPIWPALSGLRRAHPAHRVRRKRVQLLSEVPDSGTRSGRPGALALASGGLAAESRRTRGSFPKTETVLIPN